jgi:TolA-binding protein
MDELHTELEEIKREIVESRALTIKTNNLVNALSADLKSIAKRQNAYEQTLRWNGTTFYVVVVGLLLLCGKLVLDARVDAIVANTKDTREKVQRLEKEVKQYQSREEARARAERRAAEYYALVLGDKRREVIEQFDEIEKLDLSRTERVTFERAAERARNDLSLMAYQTGVDHARTLRWHEAEESLREALRYRSDASHSYQARYELARALRALGRQREAIPMLLQLSETSPDKEVLDDAMFLLAMCQVDIEAWNDAKTTLRSFIRRFPTSPLAYDARLKLAEIQLRH